MTAVHFSPHTSSCMPVTTALTGTWCRPISAPVRCSCPTDKAAPHRPQWPAPTAPVATSATCARAAMQLPPARDYARDRDPRVTSCLIRRSISVTAVANRSQVTFSHGTPRWVVRVRTVRSSTPAGVRRHASRPVRTERCVVGQQVQVRSGAAVELRPEPEIALSPDRRGEGVVVRDDQWRGLGADAASLLAPRPRNRRASTPDRPQWRPGRTPGPSAACTRCARGRTRGSMARRSVQRAVSTTWSGCSPRRPPPRATPARAGSRARGGASSRGVARTAGVTGCVTRSRSTRTCCAPRRRASSSPYFSLENTTSTGACSGFLPRSRAGRARRASARRAGSRSRRTRSPSGGRRGRRRS